MNATVHFCQFEARQAYEIYAFSAIFHCFKKYLKLVYVLQFRQLEKMAISGALLLEATLSPICSQSLMVRTVRRLEKTEQSSLLNSELRHQRYRTAKKTRLIGWQLTYFQLRGRLWGRIPKFSKMGRSAADLLRFNHFYYDRRPLPCIWTQFSTYTPNLRTRKNGNEI